MSKLKASVVFGICVMALPLFADAAIVQTAGVSPASVDLTIDGTVDWNKWSFGESNTLVTTGKSGATEIGPLNLTGGGPDGPETFTGFSSFSWSDGDSPATGTGLTNGPARDTWGGQILTLSVNADAVERELKLYTVWRFGSVRVSAQLASGGPVSTLDTTDAGYGTQYGVDAIRFSSVAPNDVLNISVSSLTTPDFVTTRAGFAAATLSVVPEPTTLGLVGLSGLCLMARRQRKSH